MFFGQVVIGPPGSGKTTYARSAKRFLESLGRRPILVNLDPANESLPSEECDIDVRDIVSLEDAMESLELGPNGSFVFCMEYLASHVDWLVEALSHYPLQYVIFDCPGQVELTTHNESLKIVLHHLVREMDARLTAVHLVDSLHARDASRFLSASLVSLLAMVRLELPHVNVLSKLDAVEAHGPLPLTLDTYTDMQDLSLLLSLIPSTSSSSSSIPASTSARSTGYAMEWDGRIESRDEEVVEESGGGGGEEETGEEELGKERDAVFFKKHRKLHERFVQVLEDTPLVNFATLAVEDRDSMVRLTRIVDKANGFVFVAAPKAEEGTGEEVEKGGKETKPIPVEEAIFGDDTTESAAAALRDATRYLSP